MLRMRRRAPGTNLEAIFLVVAVFASLSILSLHRLLPALSLPYDRVPTDESVSYKPAQVEVNIFKHLGSLGYNTNENASGCKIWHDDPSDLKPPIARISAELHGFRSDLKKYIQLVEAFPGIGDLRHHLDDPDDVCKKVELHEKGLMGIFHNQLSLSRSGYLEPLMPPLRHPEFCFNDSYLIDPTYLVHDFGAMCRKLKKTSRIVLLDMGASLNFHEKEGAESPTMYLIRLFRKFGFPVDHVYAYEVTPTPAGMVYDAIPMELIPAYHWINVGVDGEVGHRRNPFTYILNDFNEDDLILVKLDIDNPGLESTLSEQLNNATLGRLIDQFYFEKHVHLEELAVFWADSMEGSVMSALMFFYHLRRNGVAAHFWV